MAFPVLLSIGVIDSAIRMAFLTFLPFLLTAKGASLPDHRAGADAGIRGRRRRQAGVRLHRRSHRHDRDGVAHRRAHRDAILALLPLSLEAGMLLLPVIGVALNGTSSVLYGSVPDLVAPERRARAFSIFYTGSIGAGALAPALFGIVGDIARRDRGAGRRRLRGAC